MHRSLHAVIRFTAIPLFIGLGLALLVTDASAVEATSGTPFSAADPTKIVYTPGTFGTLLPIEVNVESNGDVETLAGDCQAIQVGTDNLHRRLVCPAIGAVPMTLVQQQPERLVYMADLRNFQLAPGLAGQPVDAVLFDDDDYATSPVIATRNWYGGLVCTVEASDKKACNNLCSTVAGAASAEVDARVDPLTGGCAAFCTCLTVDGGRIGTVNVASDMP